MSQGSSLPTLCVINYNGGRYLERSLTGVETLRGELSEVLLVDDASTDGSAHLVEQRFPWVRVLRLDRNRGPAAARNAALQAAQADRVLLVDNDVYVPPSCVERLTRVLDDNPRAALAMARIVHADRPDLIQYDRAEPHFLGLQIVGSDDRPLADAAGGPSPTGSLISACFLVDRARLGPEVRFDEDFFIYLEDHDFGLRARGQGLEIVAVPDVVCLHGEGTEHLSIRRTGVYSKGRVFCLIRNRWLVIAKNYRMRTLLLLAPALALYEAAQLAIVIKKGWLAEWLASVQWMVTHVSAVAGKRRAALASRVIPDRELLRGGPIPFRRELVASRFERGALAALNALMSAYWSWVKRWV